MTRLAFVLAKGHPNPHTFDVRTRDTRELLGIVWRARTGWSARTVDGRNLTNLPSRSAAGNALKELS